MLAENLKRIRNEKRFNRVELAKLADCTATTIQMIEYGINDNPRIKTLINLAKALKVSVNTLIK